MYLCEKNVMTDEIAEFGGLKFIFLIILRELHNRMYTRVFGKFVNISMDKCEW